MPKSQKQVVKQGVGIFALFTYGEGHEMLFLNN